MVTSVAGSRFHIFEHRARERVGRGADPGDTDPFPLEILGRFDFRVDDKTVERPIEDRSHEQRVSAVQIRADAGIGHRLSNRDFAG